MFHNSVMKIFKNYFFQEVSTIFVKNYLNN